MLKLNKTNTKLSSVLEHVFVFVGDILPYGVIFLMTIFIGFKHGLETSGLFSLVYVYVALVTGVVCGPSLLSIRRRMPTAKSPGAVVLAALTLRSGIIFIGATFVVIVFVTTETRSEVIGLMLLLFIGRLFETSVDCPAISVQYLRGAWDYCVLRIAVFSLISAVISLALFTFDTKYPLISIATGYVLGSFLAFFFTTWVAHKLLLPATNIPLEFRGQLREFKSFFLATALFLAASRLHPIIIGFFYGSILAGQFAVIQNLFAALALAATGVSSVFFWSQNRKAATGQLTFEVPWPWMIGALFGGLMLGGTGAFVIDFLYLRPLQSSIELLTAHWILCLSIPFLLSQSIISNLLVLQKRDHHMLMLSILNALIGLCIIVVFVHNFGIVGASLSIGTTALIATIIGIIMVRRSYE